MNLPSKYDQNNNLKPWGDVLEDVLKYLQDIDDRLSELEAKK